MFLGEKGCYLNMTAIEMREARYNDTHCVKVSLPKEQYDAMTEEERNSTPILGGMHEIKASPKPIDTSAVVVDDDDLPFYSINRGVRGGSSGSNPRSVVLALNAPQIQTFLQ